MMKILAVITVLFSCLMFTAQTDVSRNVQTNSPNFKSKVKTKLDQLGQHSEETRIFSVLKSEDKFGKDLSLKVLKTKVKGINKNNVEAMGQLSTGLYKKHIFYESSNEWRLYSDPIKLEFVKDVHGDVVEIIDGGETSLKRAAATKEANSGARNRHYFNTNYTREEYTEDIGIEDRTIAVFINEGILLYRYDRQRSFVFAEPYWFYGELPPQDIDALKKILLDYKKIIEEEKKQAEAKLAKTFEGDFYTFDSDVNGLSSSGKGIQISRDNATNLIGILDKSGKKIIDYKFDEIKFDGTNLIVMARKYYKIINTDLKPISNALYTAVLKKDGHYRVAKDGKIGIIDLNGKQILEQKYYYISGSIIPDVVLVQHINGQYELRNLRTGKGSGLFQEINEELYEGRLAVEKDGQYGFLDPNTFKVAYDDQENLSLNESLLEEKKSDPNVIEMSWSAAVSIDQEIRRYFGVIWNKRTGEHRMYNPMNIFDPAHKFKPLPENCHLTKEQIAPFLHEYGDIMFDVDASPGDPFRYEMLVWNTYTGKVGYFVFKWDTKSFVIPEGWYIHKLNKNTDINSEDGVMLDFEMDHAQTKLRHTSNYISWNKKSLGGKGIGSKPTSLFPNYDPEVDGEIMVNYDIGKNTSVKVQQYLHGALVYTTKSLKHRYLVGVEGYSSDEGFSYFPPYGKSDLHIPSNDHYEKDNFNFSNEHLVLHSQTYRECDASGIAYPKMFVIDYETKNIKTGYINFELNGATVKGDMNTWNEPISDPFYKPLFDNNDGQLGASLMYDEQLSEEILLVWNKTTGHFSFASNPTAPKDSKIKNTSMVMCNLLDSKYASGVPSGTNFISTGSQDTEIWKRPSLPENFCEERIKSTRPTENNNGSSNATSSYSSGNSSSSTSCTFTVKNTSSFGRARIITKDKKNGIDLWGGKTLTFDCDEEVYYFSDDQNSRTTKIGGGSSSAGGQVYTVESSR